MPFDLALAQRILQRREIRDAVLLLDDDFAIDDELLAGKRAIAAAMVGKRSVQSSPVRVRSLTLPAFTTASIR